MKGLHFFETVRHYFPEELDSLRAFPGLILFALIMFCGCGDGEPGRADPLRHRTLDELIMAPGLYDFYGTFWDDPIYSDGSGACAIPAPLDCPSVTTFSIYELNVEDPGADGLQRIRGCSDNPADPYYDAECATNLWNVAVGKVWMLPFILSDWDGGGQVVGTLDPGGGKLAAYSETSMRVEETVGFMSLPSWRIVSWTTSLSPSADSPPGTMVLTVPYQNNLKPPAPAGSPLGTYDPPASTTYEAVCRVENPEASKLAHSGLGSALKGNRARLVTPHSILRTVIGIIPMGSDVMSITTWDGTFCRRDDPDRSCIPADFPRPDLHD